jgi:DNA-binding Lrp family transcriptional regulator
MPGRTIDSMDGRATATDDADDRRLIVATQAGLPLVSRPYDAIAGQLGMTAIEVQQRLQRMLDDGRIRRIGAVPNHYALGYAANGMSVWDVEDAGVDVLGARVGALAFVSHCYRRPRRLPDWPYNLFAMIHATSRNEVEDKVGAIAGLLGDACRRHDVLYSSRILKKTGLRLAGQDAGMTRVKAAGTA